jgi:hypothetical protein
MHEPTEAAVADAPPGLVTVLDRLLDTGVVLDGQLVLTVAGVDLVFIGLRALLASVDTARRIAGAAPPRVMPAP